MRIKTTEISDVIVNSLIVFLIIYVVKSALGINTFKEYHLEDMPGLVINKILE
jgi:hypothetical protein